MWRSILERASSAQLPEFYDWFAAQMKQRAHCFGIELIEDILFQSDWDETYLQKNLALLDELLANESTSSYQIPTLLERQEETMRACGREMYRNVLHHASVLSLYQGGETLLSQLLTDWQTRYPRRSAMLDEIRKLQKRVRRRNTASL